jgi:putative addiction module CopG family antidote
MTRTTTMTVRLSGALSDFVAANVGETGSYENVSEYIRDLIRRDRERVDEENFQRLKAELKMAFAAPREDYHPLTLDDILRSPRPSE